MKKIKKIMFIVSTLIMCFIIAGCGRGYSSSYKATTMVKTNINNKASISFGTFSGVYVMQLHNKTTDEAYIAYEATLETGNINVYYDYNGEKLELLEINSNGDVDGKSDTFSGNQRIYIIIESEGKCNEGSFSFTLMK